MLKLLNINLQTFNGKYDQWITFRNTFEAIIDSNTNLSKIQKFYYLQSAVKGIAAQCFQSLSLSNENYDTIDIIKVTILKQKINSTLQYPSAT